MRNSIKSGVLVLSAIAFVAVAVPAHATISADLAKKCRALMIKAHPTVLYGATGVAADQRAYFTRCLTRQGDMPEARDTNTAAQPAPSTTGQGVPQ